MNNPLRNLLFGLCFLALAVGAPAQQNRDATLRALEATAQSSAVSAAARINALWLLKQSGKLDASVLVKAINDPDSSVRKNALQIVAENYSAEDASAGTAAKPGEPEVRAGVLARLSDADARVKLNALLALAALPRAQEIVEAVIGQWPDLKDKHLQSAAIGVAAKAPAIYLDAVFNAKDPAFLADFIPHLMRAIANRQDAALAGSVVASLAKQSANTDGLKQIALDSFTAALKADVTPAWSAELHSAFKALLASSRPGLSGAALPLIARWDKTGTMAADLKPVISQLNLKLADSSLPDDQRAQVAVNLLGVRQVNPDIVPSVGKILGASASPALQTRVIDALGGVPDTAASAALIGAYPSLAPELQEAAFAQLIKRAESSLALLQAIQDNKISLAILGTSSTHRLRTHADKNVAERANKLIDELRGPEQKEKDKLIAQFESIVQQRGNVENGHKLYTANCAVCHKFKGEGREVAPDLTGMGAHGPLDLLVHIVDPNRVVEPNFLSVGIETKDDLSYDGVITRENRTIVSLRNATGDFEIRTDNIKSRRATGLSLMPNGFEAMDGEGLRDLIGYLCADESKFRILDLRPAFTANSTRGIYASAESTGESLLFKKFGVIKVGDIPFEIISPAKSPTGNNVTVLKGGQGLARTYPKNVEFKAGVAASKLHFLGGVGGWAYPWGGDNNKDLPVAKVTLHFAGGGTEEIIIKNGVEIADYNGNYDVPGSKEVPDVMRRGQLRWFTKPVKGAGVIERISMESFDKAVAPTFVAITAELAATN